MGNPFNKMTLDINGKSHLIPHQFFSIFLLVSPIKRKWEKSLIDLINNNGNTLYLYITMNLTIEGKGNLANIELCIYFNTPQTHGGSKIESVNKKYRN